MGRQRELSVRIKPVTRDGQTAVDSEAVRRCARQLQALKFNFVTKLLNITKILFPNTFFGRKEKFIGSQNQTLERTWRPVGRLPHLPSKDLDDQGLATRAEWVSWGWRQRQLPLQATSRRWGCSRVGWGGQRTCHELWAVTRVLLPVKVLNNLIA